MSIYRVEYIVEDQRRKRQYLKFSGDHPDGLKAAMVFAEECDTDVPGRAPHRVFARTIITHEVEVPRTK